MHRLILALALATSTPAWAQTAMPIGQEQAETALAQQVAERMWPAGTYMQLMKSTFDTMRGGLLTSGKTTNVQDSVAALYPSGKPRKTLMDLARETDPHFDERSRLVGQIMREELTMVAAAIDPEVRKEVARTLAERFNLAQLRDIAQFFATPSGAAFAAQAAAITSEPGVVRAIAGFTPAFLAASVSIEAKVKAATAHLPAPRAPGERVSER